MLILAFIPLAIPAAQVVTVPEQATLRSWQTMPSVGDVDGDGLPDLIHEHDRVLSLVSGADPTVKLGAVSVPGLFPEHAGPTWAVGPDMDGDGVLDLAVLNGFAFTSSIFIDVISGRTGESLGRTAEELPGHTMSVCWTDDIDGDGLRDIAAGSRRTQAFSSKSLTPIWGTRVPKAPIDAPSLHGGQVIARTQVCLSEDLDGDGVRDLAIGVRLAGEQAHAAQLGETRNFSYTALSGATGAVIKYAPRIPMDLVPIETFSWLTGDWIQRTEASAGTMSIEESWNSPAAGMMLGLSRTSIKGATEGQFEFLRLSCAGRDVMLYPLPGGQQREPFRLRAYGADSAEFENANHDFPQVIRYWREGDELHASIGTLESPAQITFAFVQQTK